ncbi:MAG: hypothetical protein JST76_01390 [Bacteroidetes bacterium]|nr:hypothetical protein [Bacteroidota bacterium]
MKNKMVVIAMLIVTGLVWGMIAYRIISAIGSQNSVAIPDSYAPISSMPAATEVDTFSLLGDYRDPFLTTAVQRPPAGRIHVSNGSRPAAPPAVTGLSKPVPPSLSSFPAVTYLGRVQNNDAHRKVAIVMIGNTMRNMAEGETYHEITLAKVAGDSILVSHGREKKMIGRGSSKKQPVK